MVKDNRKKILLILNKYMLILPLLFFNFNQYSIIINIFGGKNE